MNKVRLGVVSLASAVALVAGSALAGVDAQKLMGTTYPGAPKAKCGTCHTKAMPKKGDADVNAYGKALGTAKKDGKFDFAKIEKLDSDGDGVSNLDEIKKGTNPGDPASK
ncbi:MAG TPA: thrombospondin type 3 repeat-containing protein [Thermoanaerobaculia bacterium]|nr:thrombospondin type 3 repeat-containing protein [Thermoanaerobaculia bacterium]